MNMEEKERQEKRKNYDIYVEDYAICFLRYETGSLDMQELSLYGERKDGGRKLIVYGAGRGRNLVQFAEYERLTELSCMLTQAGIVFCVQEEMERIQVEGYSIFYEVNEAMQNYLIEWKEQKGGSVSEQNDDRILKACSAARQRKETVAIKERGQARSWISAQLGILLLFLIAIVVVSTNSYDKMLELSRTARDVFFSMENREVAENDLAHNMLEKNETEVTTDVTFELSDISEAASLNQNETDEEESLTTINMKQLMEKENQNEMKSEAVVSDEPEGTTNVMAEVEEEGLIKEEFEEKDLGNESEAVMQTEQEDATDSENAEKTEDAFSRNVAKSYEIQRGDTLYMISKKVYGDFSKVEQICKINSISDPDDIYFGQKIILP